MLLKTALKAIAQKSGYVVRDADHVPDSTDRKVYDYYLKDAASVRTIFDVGANIGQTALAFSSSFPNAVIYSFEPFSRAFDSLKGNTAHLPTVRCHPVALGDVDTTLEVATDSDTPSSTNSLVGEKQEQLLKDTDVVVETITVRTGKSFCSEQNITAIDILKIDTEGYEIAVLNGFGDILDGSVKAVLSEFCLMEDRSFQTPLLTLCAMLLPKGFQLASLYEIWHHSDGAFNFGNALFIHRDHLNPDRHWESGRSQA